MRFEPKTEEEVKSDYPEEKLWPAGTYDFEILNGKDAKTGPRSKNPGADMIKLRLKIFTSGGESKTIFDNLMEALPYKLRHAAEACGNLGKYETGELVGGDFEGCTGKLKLRIGKPTEDYPEPKNEVADYVVPEGAVEAKPKKAKASPSAALNDELPEW